MNHQKAEGNTRDRMMITPARIATKPNRVFRPLRNKTAPRDVNSSQFTRRAV